MLGRYGHSTWFNLGDYDLATHIHRSERLRHGWSLSAITDEIRQALGVVPHILPMTDQRAETKIVTDEGVLHFQEYLVQRRTEPAVQGVVYEGIELARPAPASVKPSRRLTALSFRRAIPSSASALFSPSLACARPWRPDVVGWWR